MIVGSQIDTVGSDVSTVGLLTINGTGGIGNNIGATGVAVFGPSGSPSTVESLGGVVINGTGGTVATGIGSAVGVSVQNAVVATTSLNSNPTPPRHIAITGHGGTSAGGNAATGIAVSDGSVIQTQGIDVPEFGGFQTGFGNITLAGFGGTAATSGSSNGISILNNLTPSGGSVLGGTGSITSPAPEAHRQPDRRADS